MANEKETKVEEVIETVEETNEIKTSEVKESKMKKFGEKLKPIGKKVWNGAKNVLAVVGGVAAAAYVIGAMNAKDDNGDNMNFGNEFSGDDLGLMPEQPNPEPINVANDEEF